MAQKIINPSLKKLFALIAALFFLIAAHAQIVYTHVNPHSVINGTYNLDLNNDGINDFEINDSTWIATFTNCGAVMDYTIEVTPSPGNAVLCDSSHNPFPFQANEIIETSSFLLSWSAIPHQGLQVKNFSCVPYIDRTCNCTRYRLVSYNGAWPNGLEAYLGLKLSKNGNTYFGWVRLSFTDDHVTIHDYAFNSMPGQSLLAREGSNILPEVIPAIQWQKSLAGPDGVDNSQNGRPLIQCIKQTTDGGYIVSGATELTFANGNATGWHQGVDNYGFLTTDSWIVKLDNTGNVVWQKALGGTGNDYATSIYQTIDGGYIVAGYTTSNNGDVTGLHQGVDENDNPTGDYWIVKLNSAGDIVWEKCLGGAGDDGAASILQTADGGYIVAGVSASADGDVTGAHQGPEFFNAPPNYDYWIVKLDNAGSIIWQKCLGGSNGDEASSIQQTANGGYIVAGSSGSYDGDLTMGADAPNKRNECWVVKLDNTGNISWQKSLGGTNSDGAGSIQNTSDGGYIVAGGSSSNDGDATVNFGNTDYWVVKLDNAGSIEWQKSLGGTATEGAKSIQQTADGGYIVAGLSGSNSVEVAGSHGEYDYWVIKLDNTGTISWRKSLGGTGDDEAKSIQQTADGGYILAGFSNSNDGDVTGNHGGYDIWIVKLGTNTILPLRLLFFKGILENNTTKLTWQTTNEINTAVFIVERSSNGKDFFAIGKLNAQISSALTNPYRYTDDAPWQGINYYRLKMEDTDGKFTYSAIVKINYSSSNQITIAPNPFSHSTGISFSMAQLQKVSVQIFDLRGRLIKTLANTEMQAGMHQLVWNARDEKGNAVPPGIYFLNMDTGNKTEIKKLLITN